MDSRANAASLLHTQASAPTPVFCLSLQHIMLFLLWSPSIVNFPSCPSIGTWQALPFKDSATVSSCRNPLGSFPVLSADLLLGSSPWDSSRVSVLFVPHRTLPLPCLWQLSAGAWCWMRKWYGRRDASPTPCSVSVFVLFCCCLLRRLNHAVVLSFLMLLSLVQFLILC